MIAQSCTACDRLTVFLSCNVVWESNQTPGSQIAKMPAAKGSFYAERAAMAAHVVAEAQRLHPKQIQFRFDTSIQVDRQAVTPRPVAGMSW